MRSKEQILAEVVDSLIRQGDGLTPPEIGALVEIGTRLHNECPDADPAFLRCLEQRLRAEWAPPGRAGRLLATLAGWRLRLSPRLLRAAAATFVAAVVLVALAAGAPLLHTAQASLGHAISLLRQARIEQPSARPGTPPPAPKAARLFSSLEEAQAAGFAVRAPTYLPHGLRLLNVRTVEDGGQERLILQYAGPLTQIGMEREYLTIQQFRADEADEAAITLQGDLGGVERLQVAGRTALWIPRGPGSAGARKGWEIGDALLVQDGEVLVELFGNLGRDESVRIAESMFS